MKTLAEAHPPEAALEYAEEVRKRLGRHARQIILFGSQARGEATERSDHDFVVIVDRRTSEARALVSAAGGTLLDRREALCAALIYDDAEWREVLQSPLGWNIEREGVVL